MKVKFTKLAALLLAGAALFATGCTDYEVDIQKVDKKVDDLTSGKVATLESQVAALQATVATLETAADHKADIDKLNKAISDLQTALNGEISGLKDRVKAIEDADFQKQINTLTEKYQELENNKASKEELAQVEADLRLLISGEIGKLDTRLKAVEKTVDDLTKEGGIIDQIKDRIKAIEDELPTIRQNITDLQNGKLDKAEFDDYYKKAYEKYTKATIDLMQEAIDALTALTAGFPEDKTIKEYIDEADQTLKDDYTAKYLAVVAKAFGSEAKMEEMKGTLLGRLEACEALLAGDWGDKTVKEYIDGEVDNLQDQIDVIDEKILDLQSRVGTLEASMDKVLAALEFCAKEDEDGNVTYDLQGYIDDADKVLQDQIDEIWNWIDEYLIPTLNEIFADIYDQLETLNNRVLEALTRIQSIQYVPDYDDLKITTNMSYVYKAESLRARSENETEDEFVPVVFVDQPTQVTYQFLPAQYAQDVADGVEQFVTDPSYLRFIMYLYGYADELTEDPFTREEIKELGITGILPFFDVRPVNTRDDDAPEAPQPAFVITSVDKVDTTTGEITFTVQPVNVASAQYAANGLKPMYNIGLTDRNGGYIQGWDPDAYWYYSGLFRAEDPVESVTTFTVPVWNLDDLKAYQDRTAFAAQLRMYSWQDYDSYEDYDWDNCDWDRYYEDWDYYPDIITFFTDYENELASPYNVLYPNVSEIKILPDPYKKEDNGSVRPFAEDEIWQTLPYSALRKDGDDAIGEKPEQDPKGYRIILDQAVPVVSIDGGAPMSIEAAAEAGYNVPEITTSFKEFYYEDKDGDELTEEKKASFVETPQVYAEIEMNPAKSASTRKLEVGDVITGTYAFTCVLGEFYANGYVTITKPQGEVALTSQIDWTYSLDANVDHNLWVKDYAGTQPVEAVEGGEVYGRTGLAVTIEPNDLEETLGVTIEDFRKATVTEGSLKITTTDDEGGEVEVTTFEFPGEYPVKIDADGNLTVDLKGFEWDKVYTVKADYELDAALINVVWTITTVDRNREVIKIELPEYAFELNGEDYNPQTDTYTSKPQDFLEPLFDKFVENKLINQEEEKDYEAADDFKGDGSAGIGGKEGHLTRYVLADGTLPEGESKYVICGDDYALFYQVTSAQLKEVLDAGEPQVRNVMTFIGQQVEITWPVTVDLPGYDFLHLNYYTFNPDREVADFITKRNFNEDNTEIKWWSQAYPSYFNDKPAEGQAPSQVNRVSNRYALADYDVAYINLAELAFNVVDENDDIMSDEEIADANLVVKFDYTDETLGEKALPAVDKITGAFEYYKNLWMDNTTFYYRTNAMPTVPVKGSLAILSGDTEFPLVTRFDGNKNSVKYPEEGLDYTTYAVVRWTPFKVPPTVKNIEIVLDENKIYREPLFKGMTLDDNRPNGVSYKVIENGEWVVGNVTDPNAGKTETGNGYLEGVKSYEAYHIVPDYDYDDTELPAQLRKLLKIQYTADGETFVDEKADGLIPYIVYNYTSETQFHGVVTVHVTVVLANPWQEDITFEYDVIIKGYDD